MTRQETTRYIVSGAVIAAAYASLTYLSNAFGVAYGPIQLRLSEVLTVLPIVTPAAIPGLAIGCFIANLGSFNMADLLFGTLATLSAAWLSYALRDIKVKDFPVFSFLPPVIINALVIGFEIALFYLKADNFFWGFLISFLQIGISQLIVCFCFGIPFYLAVKKNKIMRV